MNQMLPGIDNREPRNPYIMEKSFKSFLMSFLLGTISINFGTTLCSMSYPKCEFIVQTRKSLFIYTQNFCWPLGTQVPRVFLFDFHPASQCVLGLLKWPTLTYSSQGNTEIRQDKGEPKNQWLSVQIDCDQHIVKRVRANKLLPGII